MLLTDVSLICLMPAVRKITGGRFFIAVLLPERLTVI